MTTDHQTGSPQFSIIVPTLNEAANVPILVEKIKAVMDGGIDWEVIFVDDSAGKDTIAAVRELALHDRRVRGIRRIGRHGLSSACIEGILSSSAPYVAVMDADLQHDEKLLPQMFHKLSEEGFEIVVASRYSSPDGAKDWGGVRGRMSRLANLIGRLAMPVDLSDPMSGFFALRRQLFEEGAARLSGIGFKILFDICTSIRRPVRFCELPYTFGMRLYGESKMSSQIAWDYILTIGHKIFGRLFPIKFLSFSMVGAVGAVIHLITLYLLFRGIGWGFAQSQTVAASAAMLSNFWMNNNLTFGDVRLKEKELLRGVVSFFIACGIGALVSISIAIYLYSSHGTPWFVAAVAGIAVAAVWNYSTNSFYTWRQ